MDGAGRDEGPAQQTVAAILAQGGSAIADGSDIATPEGVAELVDRAMSGFGRIDVLVNNAGIYAMDHFPAMAVVELVRQLNVHVGGSFLLAQTCWPHMSEQGYGRVVFTTSTGALGSDYLTAYGVAKAGVFGLARALAMVAAGGDAEERYPGLAAHLRACGPCGEDFEALLAAVRDAES